MSALTHSGGWPVPLSAKISISPGCACLLLCELRSVRCGARRYDAGRPRDRALAAPKRWFAADPMDMAPRF